MQFINLAIIAERQFSTCVARYHAIKYYKMGIDTLAVQVNQLLALFQLFWTGDNSGYHIICVTVLYASRSRHHKTVTKDYCKVILSNGFYFSVRYSDKISRPCKFYCFWKYPAFCYLALLPSLLSENVLADCPSILLLRY